LQEAAADFPAILALVRIGDLDLNPGHSRRRVARPQAQGSTDRSWLTGGQPQTDRRPIQHPTLVGWGLAFGIGNQDGDRCAAPADRFPPLWTAGGDRRRIALGWHGRGTTPPPGYQEPAGKSQPRSQDSRTRRGPFHPMRRVKFQQFHNCFRTGKKNRREIGGERRAATGGRASSSPDGPVAPPKPLRPPLVAKL